MNDCIFCKIIKKEVPAEIVYEDKNTLAFLDRKPIKKGHTLLIPKKHVRNLLEMSAEDLHLMEEAFVTLPKKIKKALGADSLVITSNQEPPAQDVFHAHWHIIPRFLDDGLISWPKEEYEQNESREYAEKIRKLI